VYTAGEKTGQRGELLRFPSLYFVIGSLAAACFAVMVALHEPTVHKFAEKKSYVEVSLPPPAATGEELPTGGTAGAPWTPRPPSSSMPAWRNRRSGYWLLRSGAWRRMRRAAPGPEAR
jgi:hypothetical protein